MAICIFALIAVVLDLMASGRVLPSSDWLHYPRPTAYVVLGAWSILIFLATARVSRHRDASAYVDGVFVAMLVVGFLFIPVSNLFHRTIPAFLATAFGVEVEHSYKVARVSGSSNKWCRNPIEIEGLPMMIDLCDVREEFRTQLSPGQTVTFGGTGTWMGLYVDYMLQPDRVPTALPRPRPPR
ncbi:MAG: hypothetical protein MUE83_17700 [Tabrizicola sp.]|nr:hypothetical protein [Tabrizicola sp.]